MKCGFCKPDGGQELPKRRCSKERPLILTTAITGNGQVGRKEDICEMSERSSFFLSDNQAAAI